MNKTCGSRPLTNRKLRPRLPHPTPPMLLGGTRFAAGVPPVQTTAHCIARTMPLQRVPLPICATILPYDAHEKHPLTHFRNRNVCPQIEPDPGPTHRARNIQFAFLHIAAFKHFIAKANGRQAVHDEVRALTAAAHSLPVTAQAQLLPANAP
jgi:hypothetical protein